MTMNDQIKHNITTHDKIYNKYDKIHTEIFNNLEQARLHEKLALAIKQIKTNSPAPTALDYGAGSGNLTGHLTSLGIKTTAADLSQNFLNLVKQRYSHTNLLSTLLVNGTDLSNIPDNSFDLAATYSVLHHVPDYLGIIKEMVRVLKPGGIIYIDHERCSDFWNPSPTYSEFQKLTKLSFFHNWPKFFKLSKYISGLKKLFNPRFQAEGDIHIWADDHVEWEKVKELLMSNGCEIILDENYLVYDQNYPVEIYNRFKDKIADTKLLVARKIS